MQNEKAVELKDKLAKLIAALASDTDEARQSELFSAYLRMCGAFHNYSWHNCGLIFSQKPDASRIAGFQTWKKLGRHVVAGSKGIAIFAPMTFKEKAKAEDGSEQESTRVWFRVVYVFDISQTAGEPLSELPTDCTGDGGESLCQRLLAYAAAKGITVETRQIDGTAKGYASEKGTRITLSDSLTSADRAAVLIHEISHCLLHFNKESKPNLKQRELEAEATSFVVASHFGLNPESKFYLASYGVKASDLLESLPVIQQTAAQIISACETNQQSDVAAVELAAAA